MMEYEYRQGVSTCGGLTATTVGLTATTAQTTPTSTVSPDRGSVQTSESEVSSEASGRVKTEAMGRKAESLPPNELLLMLALLQNGREMSSHDERAPPDLAALQKLLQLSARAGVSKHVMKPEPLWSGLGVTPPPAGPHRSLLPFSLDPAAVHIASQHSQKGHQTTGTHGRRGRPQGSVGRRKLLENNQENLKQELRSQLAQPTNPEHDVRVEMIRLKIQENEQRLRRLNETKTSVARSGVGEKRDRAQANSCTVNIAPKPSDALARGARDAAARGVRDVMQNIPAVVESPCKQQKLEERTIEPVLNSISSSSLMGGLPSSLNSISTSSLMGGLPSSSISTSSLIQATTSLRPTSSLLTDSSVSMLPRLSSLPTGLSPPRPTPSTGLITPPVMMTAPPAATCTFLTPPTSSLLTVPSSTFFTPPSSLLSPATSTFLTPPPSHPGSSFPMMAASSLLSPLNYGAGQSTLLEQLVSSITSQSRSYDAALTLLNRQKLFEAQTLKCLNCYSEFTPNPNVHLNIFPLTLLCGVCTLRKLIPLPDVE